jgi:hypothetical protein
VPVVLRKVRREMDMAKIHSQWFSCFDSGFATARSLNQIITYDAYNMAEVFLTQPLQIIAGSEWMSDSCLANNWYRIDRNSCVGNCPQRSVYPPSTASALAVALNGLLAGGFYRDFYRASYVKSLDAGIYLTD